MPTSTACPKQIVLQMYCWLETAEGKITLVLISQCTLLTLFAIPGIVSAQGKKLNKCSSNTGAISHSATSFPGASRTPEYIVSWTGLHPERPNQLQMTVNG